MRLTGAGHAEIEQLYRTRFRAFVLSVTAMLRDADLALDTVQDGFALALRKRGSFRREGDLEAWVWRIVVNLARDAARARRRTGRRDEVMLEPAGNGAGPNRSDDIRIVLQALPERQRLAVFLRYFADLSYAQIAEILGVAPGTVAASLNAAHRALERELSEVSR